MLERNRYKSAQVAADLVFEFKSNFKDLSNRWNDMHDFLSNPVSVASLLRDQIINPHTTLETLGSIGKNIITSLMPALCTSFATKHYYDVEIITTAVGFGLLKTLYDALERDYYRES